MNNLNILITGVGGQGIGFLSEVILRSFFYSGIKVKAVDTHGLAQRGGIVTSSIRTGDIYSPLIKMNKSDFVIAMEKNEALRASQSLLKKNGTLIFIDKEIQPVGVRTNNIKIDINKEIKNICRSKNIKTIKISADLIGQVNMYNALIVKKLIENNIFNDIKEEFYFKSIKDLLNEEQYKKNIDLIKC